MTTYFVVFPTTSPPPSPCPLHPSGSEADEAAKSLLQVQKAIDARRAEIDKLERERKFNADELCYVAQEKTIVGSACKPDTVKEVSFEDYVALHKADMDRYAKKVMPLDTALEFISDRPHLVHEHCMGYLLLHALDLGMEDRKADMKRVVKQKYHIKSMLDFAEARKAPPQSVIKPFFSRLMSDERILKDYDVRGPPTDPSHEQLRAAAHWHQLQLQLQGRLAAANQQENNHRVSAQPSVGPPAAPQESCDVLYAKLLERAEQKKQARPLLFFSVVKKRRAKVGGKGGEQGAKGGGGHIAVKPVKRSVAC